MEMDDDDTMQCQLDLMHALQNRAPLRRVEPEEKPTWIGGQKTDRSPRLVGLQAEFLQSSLAMQMRLRPQLERMAEIRTRCVYSDHWREMRNEVRCEAKRRREMNLEGEPKLLFQLQKEVERIPGWMDVQQEVRQSDPMTFLKPVQYDGFYVVKVFPSKDGSTIVL